MSAALGIIFDEPETAYFSSGFYGSTAIKDYARSPEGFYRRYILLDPMWQRPKTRALRLGSLVDSMIDGSVSRRFLEIPEEHITKSGAISSSAAAKNFIAEMEANGVEIVDRSTWRIAEMLSERIAAHPSISEKLLRCRKQATARMNVRGVPIQCRPDYYSPGEFLADLKTTSEPDLKWYPRAFEKYGYHIQAGMYGSAFAALDSELPFFHFVAQTVYPFEVREYEISPDTLDYGARIASDAIGGISERRWFTDAGEAPEIIDIPQRTRG